MQKNKHKNLSEDDAEIWSRAISGVKKNSVLKENKTVIKGTKELFIWPLLVLAMAIFIVDVWFRTVSERKNI